MRAVIRGLGIYVLFALRISERKLLTYYIRGFNAGGTADT